MSTFSDEQEAPEAETARDELSGRAMIELSVRAITYHDSQAADQVFSKEVEVITMEVEIDDLSINLLALHQPMATKLRLLIAILKSVSNLERMGDLSVNISQTARVLLGKPAVAPIVDIPLMADLVRSMVRGVSTPSLCLMLAWLIMFSLLTMVSMACAQTVTTSCSQSCSRTLKGCVTLSFSLPSRKRSNVSRIRHKHCA